MKQKRKVKSLISSRNESNVFGTTLLFLLGGVLFFGAVSLLVSSIGVEASATSNELEAYYDMEDNREVLFKLGLIPEGGSNSVNEMYFKDYSLFVKGDTGISMEGVGITSTIRFDENVNFLGGDDRGDNIASKNVTIIGGGRDIKILEDNPNAVSLGGENNTIGKGNSSSEAPVVLGGKNNEIGQNQKGSAIAGGSNNKIGSGVSYGFILGGERNIISGGNENVIVGGSNVEVRPGMSDLFVFSDGKGSFKPEGGNAFYIDVEGGLGLDGDSVNGGVTSEGAISFGEINIFDQRCESQDVGVQGSWSGCLVGCTEAGRRDRGRWEMIDHGDICKEQCKNSSDRCMINPLEIGKPDNYSSYCTTGGVNTDHSTQCAANLLTGFGNVVFETYLIDSDDNCPDEHDIHNRCVFRCDAGYHLTGNYAGGLNGRDVRCYSDCVLPWDQTKTIKHNETITGYNVQTVKCSNDDYFFPYDTAIINVPVYTYGTRWLYGMLKAIKSHGSYESCTNYDHEKLLVCDNGTLYVANSDRKTRSSTPAIGVTGANYIYSGCTLQNYRCNTGVYNLTRNYIERTGDDQISIWNNTDRGTTTGTRGLYELCLDWNADNPTQNGASCSTGSSIPANYHYKLTECQPGYHTGVGFENECKHDCYLQLRNGGTRTSHHSGHAIGYKTGDVTCNTTCESRELVCDDGDWKLGSLNGSVTTGYMYSGCFISNRYCETGVYNTTVRYDNSYYDESCVDLLGNNTNNTCDDGTTHYKLTNCASGYHFSGGRSDAIMCESNYRYYSCESMTLPSSIPLNSQRIGTFTRYWDCQLTGNESRCWKSSNNCSWECKDHYWQPSGYNLCCHDSEHLERGSCAPNHKVGSCNQYAGTLGGTNCYWAGQAELEWNGVTYVYQGGCTQVCTGCENGTTQTTYTRSESCECENYITTSTCENGEWNPALISCTEPATGCGGGGGGGDECAGYGYHDDECEEDEYCSCDVCDEDSSRYNRECNYPGGCEGPCGWADDGESLTCYEVGVQCPYTAGEETKTCNDGNWDGGDFENPNYTGTRAVLITQTCSSSLYPYTTEPDYTNGTGTSCTEYVQDGNDNACEEGDTRYSLECNEGYVNQGGRCLEVSTDCDRETLYGCTAGVKPTGTGSNEREYYWFCGEKYCTMDRCPEGQVYIDGQGCVECEAFATQNGNVCYIEDICGDNRVGMYNTTTNQYECVIVGSCGYNNYAPSNINEDWEYIRPLGTNYDRFSCKADAADVTPNSCEYSCQDGYYCDFDQGCSQPYCILSIGHFGAVDDFYENPTLNSSVPGRIYTSWEFVGSQAELDQKRNSGAEGCFVYCEKTYTGSLSLLMCGEDPTPVECETEYHFGYADEYENPTENNNEWERVSIGEFESLKNSQTPGCYWTCEEGTEIVSGIEALGPGYSSIEVCRKQCSEGEIFTFGGCLTCGKTQEPDPNSEYLGNMTKCRDIECGEDELLNKKTGICELIIQNIDEEYCEQQGYEWDDIRGICVRCLYSDETYNQDTGQCE